MAVAATVTNNSANKFDNWLNVKLIELKTDEGVFASYIRAILEGDEAPDEKSEALEAILAGITEDNITRHVNEILEAWSKWGLIDEEPEDDTPKEDVDVRLAKMLESQNLATTTHKSNYTEEEKRIRDSILAQYSQMSDDHQSEGECDDDDGGGGGGGGESGLEKNTNVANIIQAQKERRERAKLESQKKKEKDKEDREKQKQLKEEKKEKRKTVKGERRR